ARHRLRVGRPAHRATGRRGWRMVFGRMRGACIMTVMHLSLSGRHALVCGASHGIGHAAAVALADAGATVTLLARGADALEAARAALPGGGHHVLAVDLTDTAGLRAAVAAHVDAHGPVHVLVNNSGGPPGGPAHLADASAFE